MWPEAEQLPEGEHHTTYPVTVEVGGNWYTLEYHESDTNNAGEGPTSYTTSYTNNQKGGTR